MTIFKKGDRVQLTARMAAVSMNKSRKRQLNWYGRRGTVMATTTPGGACVSIRWDGLKSFDSWPKRGIELIDN
jgi:hypothetical protein